MAEPIKMFDNLNTAIVASDADFKVIYVNPRCVQLFKDLMNMDVFVGQDMSTCHKPETMDKLKALYQEYKQKKHKLDYYTMDIPDGRLTIVNVPFYEGESFAGVVEFIFESSLA